MPITLILLVIAYVIIKVTLWKSRRRLEEQCREFNRLMVTHLPGFNPWEEEP